MNHRIKRNYIFACLPVVVVLVGWLVAINVGGASVFAVRTQCAPGDLGEPRSSFELGTAKRINGKSIIISMFVDTPSYQFDDNTMNESLDSLAIACEYLSNEVNGYISADKSNEAKEGLSDDINSEPVFIYDWSKDSRLCYRAKILRNPSNTEDFETYLDNKIEIWVKYLLNTHFKNSHNDHFLTGYQRFLDVYDADNILMVIHFNIEGRAYAITYDGIDSENETLVIYKDASPAVYAHELLHLYGAHDFYSGAEYTDNAVRYLMKRYPEDIMLGVKSGNPIRERVGALTAYHLGIAPAPKEDLEAYGEFAR